LLGYFENINKKPRKNIFSGLFILNTKEITL
jgi:hypothetical protein